MLVQTVAVVLAATLVELARIGGLLERALLFVLGPVASAFVHLLLSPKREFAADRIAAELCESPHGLADALLRLEQAGELVEFRASPATEPLLHGESVRRASGLAALFATHPPVGERVAGCASSTRTGATSCAPPERSRELAAGGGPLNDEGPLSRPFARNWRRTYSPGRLPSEYHRRWRA